MQGVEISNSANVKGIRVGEAIFWCQSSQDVESGSAARRSAGARRKTLNVGVDRCLDRSDLFAG